MRPSSHYLLLALTLVSLAGCGGASSRGGGEESPEQLIRIGQLMQQKGEVGPSIDFYRRALAADNENVEAMKGLAEVLQKWGDKQGAADLYREAVDRESKDPELRRSFGKLLLELDEPVLARDQYAKALEIDSSDRKARTGIAIALDYLGDHKRAQENYQRVLKDDPQNMTTINNLAYSYILDHRFDMAIKTLEPYAMHKQATAALRQNLALAYGLNGMDADAERMAKVDLPVEKVKKNMEYYKRQRAEMAVTTAPYAEVGSYATEAMARAQIEKLQQNMGKDKGDFKPVILPEVSSTEGTPRFAVRMMGCSKPDDVTRLCETLSKAGMPCVPRGKNVP